MCGTQVSESISRGAEVVSERDDAIQPEREVVQCPAPVVQTAAVGEAGESWVSQCMCGVCGSVQVKKWP